jgi:hypothetical protein
VNAPAIVPSDVTVLSNGNNNEFLFINLTIVLADGILLSRLRKAVPLPVIVGQTTTKNQIQKIYLQSYLWTTI